MPQKAPTVHHRYTNVASRKVSNREALPPSELGAESERMAGRGVGRAEEARSASSARPRLDRRWIGCIWELAPFGHERSSWVRHILQPDLPDLTGYINDTLPEGRTGGAR
jgi:hypothetical protein